jgi:tRNA modification GTPase
MSAADTIVAPASGGGLAAIAVLRISGPRTRAVLDALCGGAPPPRHASLRAIGAAREPPLDRGLVLWFEGPASFTGEDMAEFHVHGSRAVVRAVIDAVLAFPGTRLAEPGEFARRAFENGRLDLTEVEGLADLINAETEAQRRQALAQAEGSLRALYEGWRAELVRAQALIEAGLDFADEGDVIADVTAKADPIVASLRTAIARHLANRSGERLRHGLKVVIAGAPNAGKSSLLNALAKRDVAIVSEEAGTTRDVIEVHLDLDGCPVTLLDTAGIRDSTDPIEQEGVRRARERAGAADLVLWVMDAAASGQIAVDAIEGEFQGNAKWIVWNKIDLISNLRIKSIKSIVHKLEYPSHFLSALTELGFTEFLAALEQHAQNYLGSSEPALVTRARHRYALENVVGALDRALTETAPGREDVIAEELRLAARALGRLTGRVDVEDVLDVIFRDFCIGK